VDDEGPPYSDLVQRETSCLSKDETAEAGSSLEDALSKIETSVEPFRQEHLRGREDKSKTWNISRAEHILTQPKEHTLSQRQNSIRPRQSPENLAKYSAERRCYQQRPISEPT
jgi:hypothetical protein